MMARFRDLAAALSTSVCIVALATPAQAQDRSFNVPAGSIAVTQANATLVTEETPTTVQAELAWRDGQLIFRNDTLAEAAAEFNRYNDRKLVVTGKAAQLKIGGSFKASNVDGFSRLLRDAYGLNVTSSGTEVVVTE
jgi:transmembrane sensor